MDSDGSLEIGFKDFCNAAARLCVKVDTEALFGDDSPESLTLSELAPEEGELVDKFRAWMTSSFGGPAEMYMAFEGPPVEGSDGRLYIEEFCKGCWKHGFEEKQEQLDQVFSLLDMDNSGFLEIEDVMFLELDKKAREGSIQKAKQKHVREHERQMRAAYSQDEGRVVPKSHRRAPRAWHKAELERLPVVLQERQMMFRKRMKQRVLDAEGTFRHHIDKRYGNGVRAWRQELDPSNHFSLNKIDLGRFCRAANVDVDVGSLMKALDQDHDGVIRLEGLGAFHAVALACFQSWAIKKFGCCDDVWEHLRPVAAKSTNWRSDKTMNYGLFIKAITANGWPGCDAALTGMPASADNGVKSGDFMLAGALDLNGSGVVRKNDLEWLDTWTAPVWLSADPDPEAWNELKGIFIRKYGQPLRAWRKLLDMRNINHTSWPEFQFACKKVGFTRNVVGAWRHLDADVSGAISLQEFDWELAVLLASFQKWIETRYGSVEFAFRTIDTDGSGTVSFSELSRACRRSGWPGCVRTLFTCLDVDVCLGKRTLSYTELSFLDNWIITIDDESPPSTQGRSPPSISTSSPSRTRRGCSPERLPGAISPLSGTGSPSLSRRGWPPQIARSMSCTLPSTTKFATK